MIFHWEKLSEDTYRAKTYGGWMVKSIKNTNIAMIFIPDEKHQWLISNPL